MGLHYTIKFYDFFGVIIFNVLKRVALMELKSKLNSTVGFLPIKKFYSEFSILYHNGCLLVFVMEFT